MDANTPSGSAYDVALMRAQHQLADGGAIFRDPLAIPITGKTAADLEGGPRGSPKYALLRQFIAARSRFAEDSLAAAVERGVRQVVLLGAGFDTFGLRNPYADKGVRVFEVDRPATQRWKRRIVAKANLTVPPELTFVAVDFERESFLTRLAQSGFSPREPAFFSWLGVLVYLSRRSITLTFSSIAKVPEAEVVFDYGEPPASIAPEHRAGYREMIAHSKAGGEPWLSVATPAQMAAGLSKLGFVEVEDLGPEEIAARYYREGSPIGGHIVRARKAGQPTAG